MKYINRSIEPVIKKAVGQFPAIALTGARQSGKTTLLRHLFKDGYRYVSLEAPDIIAAANADPRGFLAFNKPPIIFDEIQYAPALLPYIKEDIDANRDKSGRYILTGSQNLALSANITETLAGRVGLLNLWPLSLAEITQRSSAVLPWEAGRKPAAAPFDAQRLWERMVDGLYPEVVANTNLDPALWQSSYIQTYLERDIRGLRNIGNLADYHRFLLVLASRSGQLVNLSDIGRDIGVATNTIKQWVSILEATYQVVVLRPYHVNLGKRLVKTPKIYLTDTGLLCSLMQIDNGASAAVGPMAGAIIETIAIIEIMKRYSNRGLRPQVYFWRTSNGTEVDLVIDLGGRLVPVEIKSSATPRIEMTGSMQAFMSAYGKHAPSGYLLHTGTLTLPLAPGITAIPISAI